MLRRRYWQREYWWWLHCRSVDGEVAGARSIRRIASSVTSASYLYDPEAAMVGYIRAQCLRATPIHPCFVTSRHRKQWWWYALILAAIVQMFLYIFRTPISKSLLIGPTKLSTCPKYLGFWHDSDYVKDLVDEWNDTIRKIGDRSLVPAWTSEQFRISLGMSPETTETRSWTLWEHSAHSLLP